MNQKKDHILERKTEIKPEQMLSLKNMNLSVRPESTTETSMSRSGPINIKRVDDYLSYLDHLTLPEGQREHKTIEAWREAHNLSSETLRQWEDREQFLTDYWNRLRRNLAKYINFASVLVQFQSSKDYLNIAKDIITPAREQPTPQIINIENMTINQLNNMLVNLEKYID